MTYLEKITVINAHRTDGLHAERICSELVYLDGISKVENDRYNAQLEQAYDLLLARIAQDGVITRAAVDEAEQLLMPLVPVAKSYRMMFVSHAHIDMNWMWGYQETAALTVDTFRTILDLMREYPTFTYAQSQASTYEIIEKFAPEMLDEIRQRVHEGRWEVTAAEWVETDKNMPDGESLTRQILQAKKYLSGLLDIPADSLCINFLPDTFGHNANAPEILANAGVRYFYHCRGYETSYIYRFTAPSGKSVLAYREYQWYNGEISTVKFEALPSFCARTKVKEHLCVYGVGDHGGGPSRRDIERILAYQSWPLTPTIEFGTFRKYFEALEQSGIEFPAVTHELNSIFTGCYTTQSRIKMANRISEARMNEAEALSAMATGLANAPCAQENFDAPWRNLLFNHFHDILPGSGTIETREYALGKFQEILSTAITSANRSMRQIAGQIDTSAIPFDTTGETISEGGGVGYFQSETNGFKMAATERGRGPVRALHVFNPTALVRNEVTELTVWDYSYDLNNLEVTDAAGNPLEFVVAESGTAFWAHNFTKIHVLVTVPPFGYTTVVLKQKTLNGHIDTKPRTYEVSDEFINDQPLVLENTYIRAVFDHATLQLTELTDLQTGETLISAPSCFFRLIQENARYGMTSWRVGPYMHTVNLNTEYNVRLTNQIDTPLYSKFAYEIKFNRSVLKASIMLKKNSRMLEYALEVDWNEDAALGERVPQLNFAVPVTYTTTQKALYEIPYGIQAREPLAHDVPSLSFLGICGETAHTVGLITDTKYGFRFYDNCGSVTLIRSAYNPDPYSDRGIHNIRFAVACTNETELKTLSDTFRHPLSFASGSGHKGTLPLIGSFLSVDGNVVVSCLKIAENNDGSVVRLFNNTSEVQAAALHFAAPITEASMLDSNENPVSCLSCERHTVKVDVPAYAVVTVKVK